MNEMITAFSAERARARRSTGPRTSHRRRGTTRGGDLHPNPIPTKASCEPSGNRRPVRLPLGTRTGGLDPGGLAVWSDLHA